MEKTSHNKKWNQADISFLKESFYKLNCKEIADKLSRTEYSIYRKATRLKLLNREDGVKLKRKNRGFTLNEKFFETPNLLNSYWAGFLAADGCLDLNRNRLALGLSEKDLNHLEKFKNDISFNGKTTKRTLPCSISKNKTITTTYHIEITSKKICEDLVKNFNISPRKTFELHTPTFTDNNLINSYICGFIDGDGSIMIGKSKIPCLSIIALPSVNQWFKDRFLDMTQDKYKEALSKIQIRKAQSTDFMSVLKFQNKTYGLNILRELNKLDVPKLERKWSKVN